MSAHAGPEKGLGGAGDARAEGQNDRKNGLSERFGTASSSMHPNDRCATCCAELP
jgi:hypothetical protein